MSAAALAPPTAPPATARMTPVSLPSAAAGASAWPARPWPPRRLRCLGASASPAPRLGILGAAAGFLDGLLGLLGLALRGGDGLLGLRQLLLQLREPLLGGGLGLAFLTGPALSGVEALLDRGVDRALAVLDLRLGRGEVGLRLEQTLTDLLLARLRVGEPALDVLEALLVLLDDRGVERPAVLHAGARPGLALLELVLVVVPLRCQRPHLGHDVVEEVVDVTLVIALPELGRLEVLVEDLLGRQSHGVPPCFSGPRPACGVRSRATLSNRNGTTNLADPRRSVR